MSKARDLADLAGNDRLDTVANSDGALSNRNLIINGAMQIWQRGTSVTASGAYKYMADRWKLIHGSTGSSTINWAKETSDTPKGFSTALKVTASDSVTTLNDFGNILITQHIEGQNLQHLLKGTANAKELTLSFWVNSSHASTYTVELVDYSNQRVVGALYTVATAGDWEYKTITFAGDVDIYSKISNDSSSGLQLVFNIDTGSFFTSGFSSSWQMGATLEKVYASSGWLEASNPKFMLAGIQLEVGDTSTPFEHRSYADELARCQRYYYKTGDRALSLANAHTTGYTFREPRYAQVTYPVTMRALPTAVAVESASSLTGGVQLVVEDDFVGVKASNYSGDIPSASYWYGGATLDAEL